jgi:winged helix DNA-binding protein
MRVTWPQALGWRMNRQLLDPVAGRSAVEVVRRLGAVQAQVASSADLAIRLRRASSRADEVGKALAEGRLIRTWAMRGALHLLTPEEGGAFLSMLAAGRGWELPSWQRHFGMEARHWERMRAVVRDALAGPALTREELVAAIIRERQLSHLAEELRSGWGTLFKPLAFQGDLCHGPSQGNRVTFTRPDIASAQWAGVPEADDAAPVVIRSYLAAYGPATTDQIRNWLARGRVSIRRMRAWVAAMGVQLTEVDVDGSPALIRAEDVDELAAARPSTAVRLLPGFDAYVLGPGTDDGRVVAPRRRSAVSRQAGWISPVVISGGIVTGTWGLDADAARIEWFREAGEIPRGSLLDEVQRLAGTLGRDLRAEVTTR